MQLMIVAARCPLLTRQVGPSRRSALTPASNELAADESCARASSAEVGNDESSGSWMKRYEAAREPGEEAESVQGEHN